MKQTNFAYITNLQDYPLACRDLYDAKRLAVDTETCVRPEWLTKGGSALDPHTGRISLLIAQKPKGIPYVFDLFHLEAAGYNPQELIDTLESVQDYQLGINYKFDMQFMKSTLDYMPERVRDIMVMGKLISNATGSKVGKGHGHSYADLCRESLSVHITGKKDLRASTWGTAISARTLDNEWWYEKVLYAATDVKYLFQIHDIMEQVIIAPLPDSPILQTGNSSGVYGFGMEKVLKRELNFTVIVAEMEYGGMPVSEETMRLYQEGVCEALDEAGVYLSRELELDTPQRDWSGKEVPSQKALKVLRSSTGLLDVLQKAINMNKLSDVQGKTLKRMLDIVDLLHASKKTDSGGDGEAGGDDIFISDDEESLFEELTIMEQSDLIALSPVVKAILEFKKLLKQEGMDLRKFINPVTGNVHPRYDQLGAATSRACIAAGMKVLMADSSLVPIEEVKVGDTVACLNNNNARVTRKVLNTWCKGEKETVEVFWEEVWSPEYISPRRSSIICTRNHLFKALKPQAEDGNTYDSFWVEALYSPDLQVWCSSPKFDWHEVKFVMPAGKRLVYDIEVEDYNNFFCQELCTHNSSSAPNSQQIGNKSHVKLTLSKAWFAPVGLKVEPA